MAVFNVDAITAITTNGACAITGDGAGVVRLGDGAVKWPETDGSANEILETDGSGQLSFVANTGPTMTVATEQATTSGTEITFGSIPAGTKMIYVLVEDLSFSAENAIDLQIGDSGGIETSGYESVNAKFDNGQNASVLIVTDAFSHQTAASGDSFQFAYRLFLADSTDNMWIGNLCGANNSGVDAVIMGGGKKSLSGELTQLKLSGGTFDAGSVSISYE